MKIEKYERFLNSATSKNKYLLTGKFDGSMLSKKFKEKHQEEISDYFNDLLEIEDEQFVTTAYTMDKFIANHILLAGLEKKWKKQKRATKFFLLIIQHLAPIEEEEKVMTEEQYEAAELFDAAMENIINKVSAAEEKLEEKENANTEFKIGDEVIFANKQLHDNSSAYYPKIGTIGTVVDTAEVNALIVQWQAGSTSNNDKWYCSVEDVIPFSKPNSIANAEEEPEEEKVEELEEDEWDI